MNVIASMLKENTGSHFLDSGGAYGRNHEKNQARNFDSEPETKVRFSIWNDKLQVEVTHNVYHFLNRCVELDQDMDRRFRRWASRPAQKGESWLGLAQEFPNWLESRGHKVGGFYGDGKPVCVNTYNGEDLLSQVLQYVYFECDGTAYIALSIHGGCDVRGGYTGVRIFRETQELGITDNARASLYEVSTDGRPCVGYNWTTDDAYHWYPGSYKLDLPLFGQQEWADSPKLESFPVSDDESLIGDGVHIVVTAGGNAHLPNGNRLEAGY